ncbi:MAG: chalcone isomerase family protein [Saccharospirillaceae bacterium]|nr:chalcone isomerase [Thalassolituus sp. HI0120]MCH2040116.1 chalcone isomerase family protein [Saccharospirillaceae bacterium]
MMRFLMSLALVLSLSPLASAKEVAGVKVAETLSVDQQQLVLNGVGIRTKFFMDIYVASLYLPKTNRNAEEIIAADEPMAIRLQIVSSMINSKRMSDSTRDGFVRSTGGNVAPIEAEVEELITAFQDAVEEGDTFDLVYEPGSGVTVYRNGESKSNVKGLKFKQALFGIWLSEDPIQNRLKDNMLDS